MIFLNKIIYYLCFFSLGLMDLKTGYGEEAPPVVEETSDADSFIVSNFYVHNWIKLPPVIGYHLAGGKIDQRPIYGVVDVVIFLASYCVPCQQLTGYLKDLENKYSDQNVRFTWIFSQDLKKDAVGFSKEYGIKQATIADDQILKSWKNPRLPGIFLGDRQGWLLAMFPSATPREIGELDRILSKIASF